MKWFDKLVGRDRASEALAKSEAIRGQIDEALAAPVSEAAAMRVSGFYRGVTLLSRSVSQIPLKLKKEENQGSTTVVDHPAINVFDTPDADRPSLTRASLIQAAMQSLCIHGRAFIRQVRVNNGQRPFTLTPIDQSRVTLKIISDKPVYQVTARNGIYSEVQSAGAVETLRHPDIIHLRGPYTDAEGWDGVSPLKFMRDTIRVSGEHNRHARKSLDGGNIKGFVVLGEEVSETAIKRVAESFNTSDADQRWKVLPTGSNIINPQVTNEQSQFIQSRKQQVLDFCRFFATPPHLMYETQGSTSWGTGLIEQTLAFVTYTLLPWATMLEGAFNEALLTPAQRKEGYYYEFDFTRMLRGSSKERAEFYGRAISSGWLSPEEARRMEGLQSVEGLDFYVAPVGSAPPVTDPEPEPTPAPRVPREDE